MIIVLGIERYRDARRLSLLTGNVATTDLQAEYEHAVSEVKSLMKEQESLTPEHLRERIKKAVKYAGGILEMMSVPKHKIAGKLMEDFDGLSRATIYRYLGPDFDEQEDVESSQGDTKNSSSGSEGGNPVFEQENIELIDWCDNMIKFYKETVRKKLSKESFLSKIPIEERKEGMLLLKKALEYVNQEWDGRQDVSERQFFTLIAATMAGNDKATELYIKYVKQWNPLTGKQFTKLMHGKATMLPPLYDPKNKKEAVELGFYGTQCKCGSWRVAPTPEPTKRMIVHCFSCKADFEPNTEDLPITHGIVIDSSRVY